MALWSRHQRHRWPFRAAILVASMLTNADAATKIQDVPSEAADLAKTFIDLIHAGELQKAYELTPENDDVGRDVATFIDKVNRERSGHDGGVRQGVVQLREVRPFQSYGNRLRCLTSGRDTVPIETSVDLSIEGLLFEVPPIYRVDLGWPVFPEPCDAACGRLLQHVPIHLRLLVHQSWHPTSYGVVT